MVVGGKALNVKMCWQSQTVPFSQTIGREVTSGQYLTTDDPDPLFPKREQQFATCISMRDSLARLPLREADRLLDSE